MTGQAPRHAAGEPDETVVLPVVPPATSPPPSPHAASPYAPASEPGTGGWPSPTGDDFPRHDPETTVVFPTVTPAVAVPIATTGPLGEASAAMGAAPAGSPVDIEATGGMPSPVDAGPGQTTGELGRSVARNSSVMAVLSIVSRATGLLRTMVVGAAIGAKIVSNDYTAANTLPNMVYELLLGGVLASVIVPLLVRARTRDTDQGQAYAQRLFTLAAVFLAAATVVAVVLAPVFTALFTGPDNSASEKHLITVMSYLLLPEIFFYGMAALFAALLNTRGHFAAPVWTPILNNVVVIATAGVFMAMPVITPPSPDTLRTSEILVLGIGTTLGIVVQAFGLWPAMRRVGFRWRWRWDWRKLHLRELGRLSGWMLAYVVVSQVGLLVLINLATRAGVNGPGLTIFNNAYLIFMMAHGIVAVSIITALMPRMSAAAAEGRHADLKQQLSLGTRLSAVVLIPITALYLVLGRPLAVVLFHYGQYHQDEAIATGWVIAVAALGLVPFSISQLQIFAFYAMPDTRTPALLNIPVVGLRILVDVLLFLVLPSALVVAGLMAGNAVSFVLSAFLGYWLLRQRIGRLGLTRDLTAMARMTAAAVLAAIPATLVAYVLTRTLGLDRLASLVQLVVVGGVLLAGYVGAAFVLRVAEVRDVAATVRAKLGR